MNALDSACEVDILIGVVVIICQFVSRKMYRFRFNVYSEAQPGQDEILMPSFRRGIP
jgi:hypothetical protein